MGIEADVNGGPARVLRLYCAYCMVLYHTHCTQYSIVARACQGAGGNSFATNEFMVQQAWSHAAMFPACHATSIRQTRLRRCQVPQRFRRRVPSISFTHDARSWGSLHKGSRGTAFRVMCCTPRSEGNADHPIG